MMNTIVDHLFLALHFLFSPLFNDLNTRLSVQLCYLFNFIPNEGGIQVSILILPIWQISIIPLVV